MYVCVCNGLNERKVSEALARGAGSVAKVYKACGCAPRCGKCVPLVRDMLERRDGHVLAEPLQVAS